MGVIKGAVCVQVEENHQRFLAAEEQKRKEKLELKAKAEEDLRQEQLQAEQKRQKIARVNKELVELNKELKVLACYKLCNDLVSWALVLHSREVGTYFRVQYIHIYFMFMIYKSGETIFVWTEKATRGGWKMESYGSRNCSICKEKGS